jgi:hypothetical protein
MARVGGNDAMVYDEAGSAPSRNGSTFRSAISCCAVTDAFWHRSTRGVQPRRSCAARSPLKTANSNALMSTGRLTMTRLLGLSRE